MFARILLSLSLIGGIIVIYYFTYFKIADYYNIQSLYEEHAHVQTVEGRVLHRPFYFPAWFQTEKNFKLFNNHTIKTIDGKALINFFEGNLMVELANNSQIKISKTEEGFIQIEPSGEATVYSDHSFKGLFGIKIGENELLKFTEGLNRIYFKDSDLNKITISVQKGQLKLNTTIIPEMSYVVLDRSEQTSLPIIGKLNEPSPLEFFADLRYSKQDPSQLSQMNLESPPRDERIQLPSSSIKKEKLQFRWQSVPGALSYHFQIAKDLDFTQLIYEDFFQVSGCNVSGLKDGNYYWRVRPKINDNYFSHFSEVRQLSVESKNMLTLPRKTSSLNNSARERHLNGLNSKVSK